MEEKMTPSTVSPLRLQILLDNYRESRGEGIKLAQSSTSDIAIAAALIGAVIGAQHLANAPSILLLLPFLIAGLLLYAIIKFRGTSLITSYMIYLERAINIEVGEPIMLWNSQIIRRSVSAGRSSIWGSLFILVVTLVIIGICVGLCAWAYLANIPTFEQFPTLQPTFVSTCSFLALVNIVALIATLHTIRTYSPQYIEKLSRTSPS